MHSYAFLRTLLLMPLVALNSLASSAQLTAGFTPSVAGGCSPLFVTFTNTTTGASAAATYNWDFGNGNAVTTADASDTVGATYSTQKTYTVTLTVTDGTKTSVKTETITVYTNPTVAFGASVVNGCIPLPVTFTSTSTAGAGSIASYFWDFGDGTTGPGSGSSITHTYMYAGSSTVSLTVTNSDGCSATLSKPNLITPSSAVVPVFATDSTFLCSLGDPVVFTNSTSGPSSLTYVWRFGDGSSASTTSPSHTYAQKGMYTVTLIATTSNGCSDSTVKSAYIDAANFNPGFSVPSPLCTLGQYLFQDQSSPQPTGEYYTFSDNPSTPVPGADVYHTFGPAGSYSVTLNAQYGSCMSSVTKNVVVYPAPNLQGFIMIPDSLCGAPVTVGFKDTTSTAVQWNWQYQQGYPGTFSTTATGSYVYTQNAYYEPTLTVTNADGCSTTLSQTLDIQAPFATIAVTPLNAQGLYSCDSLTVQCSATSAVRIKSYLWNFGDGMSSQDSIPTHTYRKPGSYTITLTMTNANGCTWTGGNTSVSVFGTPVAAFVVVPDTLICGNNPVNFTNQSTSAEYYTWNFGDGTTYQNQYLDNGPLHSYQAVGTYTVQLIATDGSGNCSDTVTRAAYLTVLPPFPLIYSATNTCNGTRDSITFLDSTNGALTWKWNFGDGTSLTPGAPQYTVTHAYQRSGTYEAYLTSTNGNCSATDSIRTYVLLKQTPLLSASAASVCVNQSLQLSINNLDSNYYVAYSGYNDEYYQINIYGDSSYSNNYLVYNTFNTQFSQGLGGLKPGKDSLIAILTPNWFNCPDTTNYIVVTISGPIAGFNGPVNICYKDSATFIDTSTGTGGVPITTWQWNFGDGTSGTLNHGGDVTHFYSSIETYTPSLTVTDSAGCSATGYLNTFDAAVTVNGPHAIITYSPSVVTPGTTVTFYNSSQGFFTSVLWSFTSDGSVSTDDNSVNHTYPIPTTDTVTLVVYQAQQGYCPTDTAVVYVDVRNVNAAFTYTTSYVNNNTCPPVVVYFTSTLTNVSYYSWSFGDGGVSQGNPDPSHTYDQPGKYFVSLTAFGPGGTSTTVTDSVIVKGPFATISVNTAQSCAPVTVTLMAATTGAVSYTWDFGDGTVIKGTSTTQSHTYSAPGIYLPALILKDSSGCAATFNPDTSIVADSLSSVGYIVHQLCDSGAVSFNTNGVYSLSNSQLGEPLGYHWNFGTGNPGDTSDLADPSSDFSSIGNYGVTLTVTSTPGCVATSVDSVLVNPTIMGIITGPSQACAGDSLVFSASTGPGAAGVPAWNWLIPGGVTDTATETILLFLPAGSYTVALITDYHACRRTTTAQVTVNPVPDIALTPRDPQICQGDSVQLLAHDGITYAWSPALGLDNAAIADPRAAPAQLTTYTVVVSNQYGCQATDTDQVFVETPFVVSLPADTFVCQGDSLQLRASGAYTYQWISGTPINNTGTGTPLVDPSVNTVYTVVGYDQGQCFTDTASVDVQIEPLPTVQASPVGTLPAGDSVLLHATGSADVASWTWSPPDYLSCTACQTPQSTPTSSILYTVTATTAYGCSASDTVRIKLICLQDKVAVPNAFTPNGDGHNDVFYPRGTGVKVISHFLIYGRWGNVVFDRQNIPLNMSASGWDGKSGGVNQPAGAYIYELTLICDTGEAFVLKGTVLLER